MSDVIHIKTERKYRIRKWWNDEKIYVVQSRLPSNAWLVVGDTDSGDGKHSVLQFDSEVAAEDWIMAQGVFKGNLVRGPIEPFPIYVIEV